jgi:hypothetical protein
MVAGPSDQEGEVVLVEQRQNLARVGADSEQQLHIAPQRKEGVAHRSGGIRRGLAQLCGLGATRDPHRDGAGGRRDRGDRKTAADRALSQPSGAPLDWLFDYGIGFVRQNRYFFRFGAGGVEDAEVEEALESAVVVAADAGEVAIEQAQGVGVVRERLEGNGEAGHLVGFVELFRDFLRLFVHLQVESGCLGTPVAPLTPFGYRHFFDSVAFGVRAGIEFIEISVVSAIEAVAGLVAQDYGLGGETVAKCVHRHNRFSFGR